VPTRPNDPNARTQVDDGPGSADLLRGFAVARAAPGARLLEPTLTARNDHAFGEALRGYRDCAPAIPTPARVRCGSAPGIARHRPGCGSYSTAASPPPASGTSTLTSSDTMAHRWLADGQQEQDLMRLPDGGPGKWSDGSPRGQALTRFRD
jgi:hypothetical protein